MTVRYSFADHPEHEAQLADHAALWIANAMSTAPADRPVMVGAMRGLYEAASLEPPTWGVFVASPFAAHIAGGVAAGVWWLREHPERHGALFGRRVGDGELMAAVPVACWVAVVSGLAVLEGRAATGAATGAATYAATDAATDDDVVRFLLRCVTTAWRMHNGGSDWSAWPAYLSFFDRVAALDLPTYPAWRHYEQAALHAASRIMHTKFWIVADRHTSIHVDDQRRLHHETGPARTWADGWALWYWHGTRVPRDLIEGDGWTVDRIHAEENTEIRRCAIERIGWARYIREAGLTLVHEEPDPGNSPHVVRLYDVPRQIFGEPVRVVLMTNGSPDRSGSLREYAETVPASIGTAVEASAWQYGCPADVYRQLQRRT